MASSPPPAELLELLRVRIGLAPDDASKDAQIEAAYITALTWIETFLDRFLEVGSYTEVFTHFAGNVASLKGYPVEAITVMVNEEGESPAYHCEARNGLIHFDGFFSAHELTVSYDAAPEIHGALQIALLTLFDSVWGTMNETVTAESFGAVKSVASDGARVEFDVSSSSSGGTVDPSSGMPASVTAMLRMLRRESC